MFHCNKTFFFFKVREISRQAQDTFSFLLQFGDPVTFHLAPSSGQNFNLSSTLVFEQPEDIFLCLLCTGVFGAKQS